VGFYYLKGGLIMAKRKMSMYHTFKIDIFGTVTVGGKEVPTVSIINNRLVVNNECCDLRTVKDRYNPKTKELAPSVVNSVYCAESILAMHYSKSGAMYDFISVDCSGGNDADPDVEQVKDLLCFDGLYLPLSKLEAIGYILTVNWRL
jgi:hypothetical protein